MLIVNFIYDVSTTAILQNDFNKLYIIPDTIIYYEMGLTKEVISMNLYLSDIYLLIITVSFMKCFDDSIIIIPPEVNHVEIIMLLVALYFFDIVSILRISIAMLKLKILMHNSK